MRAKIEINEVEVRTKIRAKYLRAIENEEWNLLPGEVYVKSFLRTYGSFLGLDTRQLLDDFKRQYEPPSEEVRPLAPRGRERERERRPGPRIPSWAAIVAVLAVVLGALYFVGRQDASKPTTSTSAHTAKGHHQHHAQQSRRLHAVASKVKLQLVATGQVYVCLENGAHHRLIPGVIYAPGQTIPVKSAARLLLTLGNNAVQMKANGVSIPVGASPGSIGYELLPGSHRTLPAAQQPRCG